MRSQQTTDPPHNFTFCKDRIDDWGRIPECPMPQFAGGFPQVGHSEAASRGFFTVHPSIFTPITSTK